MSNEFSYVVNCISKSFKLDKEQRSALLRGYRSGKSDDATVQRAIKAAHAMWARVKVSGIPAAAPVAETVTEPAEGAEA